ncbi:MAG TPA: GYF domain-containing protein [Opitutaceae bacterium]|nr:GYF domain-containing protein [Opitutaceae bacterium]
MKHYFYRHQSQDHGPIPADEIWHLVDQQKLPASTMVCEEGTTEWKSFTSLTDVSFSETVLSVVRKRKVEAAEAQDRKKVEDAKAKARKNNIGCGITLVVLVILSTIAWILNSIKTNDPAYHAGHTAGASVPFMPNISAQTEIDTFYPNELSKYNEEDKAKWIEGFNDAYKGQ